MGSSNFVLIIRRTRVARRDNGRSFLIFLPSSKILSSNQFSSDRRVSLRAGYRASEEIFNLRELYHYAPIVNLVSRTFLSIPRLSQHKTMKNKQNKFSRTCQREYMKHEVYDIQHRPLLIYNHLQYAIPSL